MTRWGCPGVPPGRRGDALQEERLHRAPGRALVPPPPQPGPAQPAQEIPGGQVRPPLPPPFLPDVTVPLSWGGLWGHPLGREPPGRVGSAGCGAGGSVLLPPAPRCPSEDRLLPFSSWRFTFYLIAFIAGMAVIVDVSIAAPSPRSPGPPDPSDSSLSVSPSPSCRNLGSTTSGRCGRDTPSR